MNNKKNIPWWLVVLMFVCFWPVGLAMLVINVSNNNENQTSRRAQYRKSGYRFDKGYVDAPYSSSDAPVGGGARGGLKERAIFSLRKGKALRGVGIGLAFFGMIVSAITFISGVVGYSGVIESMMIASIVFLSIGAPGLALTFWGQSILGKAQRYRRYAQVIGDSREVSLDRLAGAMGVSYEKVCDDLYKMIDSGYFEGYYIDNERRVMTSGRLASPMTVHEPKEEKKPAKSAEINPADRIRAINGTIIQPEVSEKIMRLETLTRRIYNYTDAYPEKDKYARSFKDRYLPKTIKILESYSRFERSGSSGENVRAAMKDVEAVLDVLIGSFEKQLDMLYMDEALDVTTDIDVLESMISGDGLGDSPFATLRDEPGR